MEISKTLLKKKILIIKKDEEKNILLDYVYKKPVLSHRHFSLHFFLFFLL